MPPASSSGERPSPLLVTAAAVYFAAAVLLLFLPEEILGWLGTSASAPGSPGLHPALLQVLAASLFGFAMLDWMSRFTVIGGIYGRPLVIANFAHAVIAALSIGRVALAGPATPALWVALALYAALAVAFGAKLFLGPGRSRAL